MKDILTLILITETARFERVKNGKRRLREQKGRMADSLIREFFATFLFVSNGLVKGTMPPTVR